MERLTAFDGEFWVHKDFPPVGEDTIDEFVDCVKELAARLASIEDILGDDYDLDRLRELVEADREGRCVVYSKGFPIVSTYLQEGGLYIRETSGVIGYEEYNAALKGEQHEKH